MINKPFGKIVEVLIKNRLPHYFERNELFDHNQFSFIPGFLTTRAIIQVLEGIVEKVEDHSVLTLCDVQNLRLYILRHGFGETGTLWYIWYDTLFFNYR